MFTGLIEELGTIRSIEQMRDGRRIVIEATTVTSDVALGDSICVDGACQTVVASDAGSFTVEAVGETLEKTTLGRFKQGDKVHLERSMRADTRMGGHMVQGHVSGVAVVDTVVQRGENWLLRVRLPEALLPLIVPEGSIAIDGVSLTVAAISGRLIDINVVPHSAGHTHLVDHTSGDEVNIETDILGRYVARMIGAYGIGPDRGLNLEQLAKWGYA